MQPRGVDLVPVEYDASESAMQIFRERSVFSIFLCDSLVLNPAPARPVLLDVVNETGKKRKSDALEPQVDGAENTGEPIAELKRIVKKAKVVSGLRRLHTN